MNKKHKEWVDRFLENCQKTNKSHYTIINYRSDLIQYIEWFEEAFPKLLLNKANSSTISKFHNQIGLDAIEVNETSREKKKFQSVPNFIKRLLSMSKLFSKSDRSPNSPSLEVGKLKGQKKLAVNSRRRKLSAIKNFYEYLKQEHEDHSKLFGPNPVKSKIHTIRLKDEDVEPTKLLTPKDWKGISKSVKHIKGKLIITLLYYGGLRLSELSSLKKSAFNKQNGTLHFARKGGDLHTLPIRESKKIFSLYEEYKLFMDRKNIESDFLFPGRTRGAITSRAMYNIIMKLISKCPHPVTNGLTPHSFRKACATNLYLETKDIILVRDYLNHSDAKVTQTYIEISSFIAK